MVSYMKTQIVQARIDARTARLLVSLRRRTGMSDSELVRKGLEILSQSPPFVATRRIRGVGHFASGRSDLGSNKQLLAGFGRS
jgi:hypothetical protein